MGDHAMDRGQGGSWEGWMTTGGRKSGAVWREAKVRGSRSRRRRKQMNGLMDGLNKLRGRRVEEMVDGRRRDCKLF